MFAGGSIRSSELCRWWQLAKDKGAKSGMKFFARIHLLFLCLLLYAPCCFAGPASSAGWNARTETVPIGSLLWQADDPPAARQVRGIVTKTGTPVYLQDRTGGLELIGQSSTSALRLGDEVEATGVIEAGRYSAAMKVDHLRVLRVRVPDPALSVTATMAASGDYDKQVIEISGTLVSWAGSNNALTLWLRSANQLYAASLNTAALPLDQRTFRIGSTLKVTGICVMDLDASDIPVPFHIVLRSLKDVEVVSGPPFWTRAHVLLLFTAIGILAIAALIAATRVQRWRFSVILDERTRLAHDLHDSLAQSFAGIGFQLHAIRIALQKPDNSGSLHEHVNLAISMVSHSHADARRSIAILKTIDDLQGNLLDSLRHQAQVLTQGGTLRLEVTTIGTELEIPSTAKQALLRIVHEAMTNSVRHASPSVIRLQLAYSSETISLTITDDGLGFTPCQERAQGFGLLGMQSRAVALGGALTERISPDHGGEVNVYLPLSRKLRPWRSFGASRRSIVSTR